MKCISQSVYRMSQFGVCLIAMEGTLLQSAGGLLDLVLSAVLKSTHRPPHLRLMEGSEEVGVEESM